MGAECNAYRHILCERGEDRPRVVGNLIWLLCRPVAVRLVICASRERGTYPTVRGLTQCGILKVLALSFFADGKSLDES